MFSFLNSCGRSMAKSKTPPTETCFYQLNGAEHGSPPSLATRDRELVFASDHASTTGWVRTRDLWTRCPSLYQFYHGLGNYIPRSGLRYRGLGNYTTDWVTLPLIDYVVRNFIMVSVIYFLCAFLLVSLIKQALNKVRKNVNVLLFHYDYFGCNHYY